MRLFHTITLILVTFMVVSLSFSLEGFKEGLWEITTDINIKGVPFPLPSITKRECLTKEKNVPSNRQSKDSSCDIYDKVSENNTVSWKLHCKSPKRTISGHGEITYTGKTMSGTLNLTVVSPKRTLYMNNTLTGRHISPCPR